MDKVLPPRSFGRAALWAATVAIAAAGALFVPTSPAEAQGWFGGFFGGYQGGGGGGGYGYPAFPGYGSPQQRPDAYAPRPRPPRRRAPIVRDETPRPDAAPAAAPVAKKNATVFVAVLGDSTGQLLAGGLDEALADRGDVGILRKAKGSTGLVQRDYFDWPKAVDEMLGAAPKDDAGPRAVDPGAGDKSATPPAGAKEASSAGGPPTEKIDVAVMMIGTNDRQSITEDGKTYPLESDEWTAAYKKRAIAIGEAFRRKGIPLIWVGMPITRDTNFANDMAVFNDIFRDVAAKTGATYVDTWEAFSDDNGAFSAYGPDINGQTVRLRSGDGIHFTKPGARKLAHFVEGHVRRALDGKVPPVVLPTDAPLAERPAAPAPSAVAVAKPEIGPITDLNDLPKAANGALSPVELPKRNGPPTSLAAARPAEPAPTTNRADDFRWPTSSAPAPADR